MEGKGGRHNLKSRRASGGQSEWVGIPSVDYFTGVDWDEMGKALKLQYPKTPEGTCIDILW